MRTTIRMLATILALTALTLTGAEAAEPTAREVLNKSAEAMKPPIRYRMKADPVETLISMKVMSNGVLAIRSEIVMPSFVKISLSLGADQYEWFPKTKLGLDVKGFRSELETKVKLFADDVGGKATLGVAKFLPEVVRDGRACYVIEEPTPDAVLVGLKKLFPEGSPLPLFKTTVVAKETLYLVEQSSTFSGNKLPPQLTAFIDVVKNPELANELFLPPDGYEFKKVANQQEYMKIIGEHILVGTASSHKH